MDTTQSKPGIFPSQPVSLKFEGISYQAAIQDVSLFSTGLFRHCRSPRINTGRTLCAPHGHRRLDCGPHAAGQWNPQRLRLPKPGTAAFFELPIPSFLRVEQQLLARAG